MIPAGYMWKQIVSHPDMLKQIHFQPDWLKNVGHVEQIYSTSSHISKDITDYIGYLQPNGLGFFNELTNMQTLALSKELNPSSFSWFYYEAYEKEFDEDTKAWSEFQHNDFSANVTLPLATALKLVGFDVVTFSDVPGCSPLSCNYIYSKIQVNAYCLLSTFKQARQALEAGLFDKTEPGPFRIFAVYTLEPSRSS